MNGSIPTLTLLACLLAFAPAASGSEPPPPVDGSVAGGGWLDDGGSPEERIAPARNGKKRKKKEKNKKKEKKKKRKGKNKDKQLPWDQFAAKMEAVDQKEALDLRHDPQLRPIEGYPLLQRRNKPMVRTQYALSLVRDRLQEGDCGGATELLGETVEQMDRLRAEGGKYYLGKQCAATRYAYEIAREAHPEAEGECPRDLVNAVGAASEQGSPILLDLNGNGVADVMTPGYLGDSGAFVREGAVRFDIRGQGSEELWEWLVPHADGLLARDVNGNGVVDSASELFGDADGFADGYAKLALLDRDGNYAVDGEELAGLVVWIDDGDGVCELPEVQAVGALGISRIETLHVDWRSTFVRGGKTFTSWDWFPRREWSAD